MNAEIRDKISEMDAANRASEGSTAEELAQLQKDVNSVLAALALLGVKRCSQCKQFLKCEPGSFFECGDLICYSCVPGWWTGASARLGVTEREKLEANLSSWLRRYHGAEVVTEPREGPSNGNAEAFRIVVHCTECHGSGKLLEGERCRFCKGAGNVWIVAGK